MKKHVKHDDEQVEHDVNNNGNNDKATMEERFAFALALEPAMKGLSLQYPIYTLHSPMRLFVALPVE